jgi:hypothetical protein
MSRLFSIIKNCLHGFSLTLLCTAAFFLILLIAALKSIYVFGRLLINTFRLLLKRRHRTVVQTKDKTPPVALSAPAQQSLLEATDADAVPAVHAVSRVDEEGVQEVALMLHPDPACVFYGDFDDEEFIGDDEPEEKREPITIQILRRDEAADPHMPSSFFPGCGSDGAQFQVQGKGRPTYSELSSALYQWADDSCLVNYSEETGIGYFRIVDGEAPEAGSVIELI